MTKQQQKEMGEDEFIDADDILDEESEVEEEQKESKPDEI